MTKLEKLKRMENLKCIEKLIEAEDEALYDEINARVWCWMEKYEIVSIKENGGFEIKCAANKVYEMGKWHYPDYTTSLDAQAPLMPEDWLFSINQYNGVVIVSASLLEKLEKEVPLVEGPTESMARLLATVRVWIWKEENERD